MKAYLTELVNRRPGLWVGDVERLQELLQEHGDACLRLAIGQSASAGLYGAEYISRIISTIVENQKAS